MTQTIFISGATGNIGSNIINSLKKKDVKIRAGVHSQASRSKLEKQGVDVVTVDFSNIDSIRGALNGCTKAFSMSPISPDLVNLGLNFLKAAQEVGIEHLLRLSGMGADNPQAISLGRMHREVEMAIEKSSIPYTFVRPNSFMQNYLNFASESIRTQKAFYFPIGDGRISLIDARDIGDVAAEIFTTSSHFGKAFTLTGPEAISNYEIADQLSNIVGEKITYFDVSESQARSAMLEQGMPEKITEWILELYSINKAGYTAETTSSVEDILGRKPRSFASFAFDHAEYFK